MAVQDLTVTVGLGHRQNRSSEVRAAAARLSRPRHDLLEGRLRRGGVGKTFTYDQIGNEGVQNLFRRRADMLEGKYVGFESTEERDQHLGGIGHRERDASAALDPTADRLAKNSRLGGQLSKGEGAPALTSATRSGDAAAIG